MLLKSRNTKQNQHHIFKNAMLIIKVCLLKVIKRRAYATAFGTASQTDGRCILRCGVRDYAGEFFAGIRQSVRVSRYFREIHLDILRDPNIFRQAV